MKRVFALLMIVLSLFVVVSCANKTKEEKAEETAAKVEEAVVKVQEKADGKIDDLEEKVKKYEDKIGKLNDKIKESIDEKEEQKAEIAKLEEEAKKHIKSIEWNSKIIENCYENSKNLYEIIEEQTNLIKSLKKGEFDQSKELIPIYTSYDDGMKVKTIVLEYIQVSKDSSIKEKLDNIASEVSKYSFSNLPIEVLRIDNIDGKKIAIINLKESSENEKIENWNEMKGDTWVKGYFQGSSGGSSTYNTLINSFIQKEYEGHWVDGVKFLYNNDNKNFIHAEGLEKITMR